MHQETRDHDMPTFQYENGKIYRMPIHFGPQPGPRQLPDGFMADHARNPEREQATVTYLVRKEQIQQYLPPGFSTWGEPTIHFDMTHQRGIEWLAGRGYSICGVRTPVVYRGKKDTVHGLFQMLYWENLTDPILSGRDEVGAPKIYCEISEPRILKGTRSYYCSWLGTRFLDMSVFDLEDTSPPTTPYTVDGVQSEGMLLYKYIPKTGLDGSADVEYATFSPAGPSQSTIDRFQRGNGKVSIQRATWEELPTMHHIVNALAGLDLLECRGATMTRSHGLRDFKDTRILE